MALIALAVLQLNLMTASTGEVIQSCREVDDASNSGVDDDECSQSDAANDVYYVVEQIR